MMLIIVMILYCGAAEAMCNVVSPYWSTSVTSDAINFSFGITLFLVQSCVRVSLKEKQSKRCSFSVSTDWRKCVGCDGAAESPAACRVLKDYDLQMLPSHHSVSVWVSEWASVCDCECVRVLIPRGLAPASPWQQQQNSVWPEFERVGCVIVAV